MKRQMHLRAKIFATIIGALFGVFILHPFSMAMYHTMMMPGQHAGIGAALAMCADAFSRDMWQMSLFYAAFGGIFGFVVGLLIQRRYELMSARLEREHHEAVRQLIEEIVLTVTHYVRNANSAVGGFTRLAMKSSSDETVRNRLRVVIESSTQIDAVMAALQTIDEKDEREEIGTTHLRILNIRNKISDYLKARPVVKISENVVMQPCHIS